PNQTGSSCALSAWRVARENGTARGHHSEPKNYRKRSYIIRFDDNHWGFGVATATRPPSFLQGRALHATPISAQRSLGQHSTRQYRQGGGLQFGTIPSALTRLQRPAPSQVQNTHYRYLSSPP